MLSLCELARFTAGALQGASTGTCCWPECLLHDIGKIHELSYDRGFGYTTEGQLLGPHHDGRPHDRRKAAALCRISRRGCARCVEHMVLSHHGRLEFGSPKVPMFPEAMLLHYLDDLDSKMECMRSLIAQDRQLEGEWTGYSQPLERSLLKKLRYLEGGATRPGAVPAGARRQPAAGRSRGSTAAARCSARSCWTRSGAARRRKEPLDAQARSPPRHSTAARTGMPEGPLETRRGQREGRSRRSGRRGGISPTPR